MDYDKILESILLVDSKEEIDGILRKAISELQQTCAQISDEEKTEFVLKLMNLRKTLGLTKEITTVGGLRALVADMPPKNYKILSKGKAKEATDLYGVFTSENQFFIAKDSLVSYAESALVNLYTSERYVNNDGNRLKSFEGVWPGRSEMFDEKLYVVKLSKIIGAECYNPYTAYLEHVLEYVNKYLLKDPSFVKNAFWEENGKLLIKHL